MKGAELCKLSSETYDGYLRWVFLKPGFHMIATIAAVAEKIVSVIVAIDMIAAIATNPWRVVSI